MSMTLKKKNDLPPPPKLPTPAQILDDLKVAEMDDPVFFEPSDSSNGSSDECFQTAKEFMITTTKLRESDSVLEKQKALLQQNYEDLRIMSEEIRKQATEALSNIY